MYIYHKRITLFSGTISENTCHGYLESSDDELEAACKAACVWEFIKDLPQKLYTVIGEHGLDLSEGQAQRIFKVEDTRLREITKDFNDSHILKSIKNLA